MDDIPLSSIVNIAIDQLAAARIPDPELNTYFLVAHGLEMTPEEVASGPERILKESEIKKICDVIDRRVQRESFARIVGRADFCGLWFGLNEATLEPRPESEVLVRTVYARKKPSFWRLRAQKPLRILDLGTGTGCLLLALLKAFPEATGVGVDRAPRAVEQACENAEALGLSDRSLFKVNNWDEGMEETFDVVVSNPPYVPSKAIDGLIPAVKNHDPHAALDGGEDGLDPYRFLIPRLPLRLKEGGLVVLEVGHDQADTVKTWLKEVGLTGVKVHYDERGVKRCLEAHKK